MPRVIVTTPVIRSLRTVVVDSAGDRDDAPARVLKETLELDGDVCAAAYGAKAAGADVTFFALCEASVEKPLRAALEAKGISCRLRVAGAASAGTTRYESSDGAVRFVVRESRLPELGDVDRLQDDLADDLLRAPAFVVVAGDLDGARRPDYAERVVGRAWGLGMKSLIVTSTPSLKQAYHTYPYGIVLRSDDVRSVCAMPRTASDETQAQTIERSFSESMRVFAIRGSDGGLTLVSADARLEVRTDASDAWVGGVLGALAAADLGHPAEVVQRAAELLARGLPSTTTPTELERSGRK